MAFAIFKRRGKSNHAYVTARVRAKKRFLLGPDVWPRLLARDVHEIARTLEEGVYKKEIDELAARFRGAELIERATRLNLGRTYETILGASQGDLRTMLALYLGRYDADNVRTILRGVFAKVSPEQILSELVPAGSISWTQLEKMTREESLEDVVADLKGTLYGRALSEYLAAHRQVDNLFELENTIDRTYYEALLAGVLGNSRATQAFKTFLREEVDFVNLQTLLRLRAEGVGEISPSFVPGGTQLDVDTATRLLKAPRDDFLGEFAAWKEADILRPGLERFLDTGNVGAAVTAVKKAHEKAAGSFGHRYPLSVLPVVDFVLRKRREVDNLRILAHGKASGLPDSVIEELIV
jgi:V/A-type H+-transporting ATPase subunit C